MDRQLVASPGPEQCTQDVLKLTRVLEWSFRSEVLIGRGIVDIYMYQISYKFLYIARG